MLFVLEYAMNYEQNNLQSPAMPESKSWIVGLSKDAIFWTSVVYALLAFLILVLYQLKWLGIDGVKFSIPPAIPQRMDTKKVKVMLHCSGQVSRGY